MTTPTAVLAALRDSSAALVRGISAEAWSDADVRAPSLLPGWSRAHVLTHLARNADGIFATVTGALRGERVPRYPHGPQGRNADIEAGAERSAETLLADVRSSADALDRLFGEVAGTDGWQLQCDDRTIGAYLTARWREVEIHRVDLAGSYTADRWPAEFVDYLLPLLVESLADRATGALRVTVTDAGSRSAGLPGTSWSVDGPGAVQQVSGPDWALLAWALGRPAATEGALDSMPELSRWT
ncbi:maleylpyruvate isomerase family mycothiol-dependent enzyme [Jatrophihabitans cynanchi]|jgi:maleylpyruvate isomerase|uniref:Maleylpyruvate isomerase family mycothiol-dependent enzyme n=1 Tax=Jatrophihabitans cynanchi TaxID=2944128 RepID=A0ABY7K2H1_9ACTN|nr:maleylpyruvate isomerase family mycothiol-dependent enzyme [Jatrophihabitans sp. SB3-54]WAX59050.1 maleylpyruvate isomerase family mycothiol-dependent enzyme [Jatrophihabitans sp. SB3-54]